MPRGLTGLLVCRLQKAGLLLSIFENTLIKEESFWTKLDKLVRAGDLAWIGLSTLSPYGLSYDSKKLQKLVHTKDFVETSIHQLEKLTKDSNVEVDLWLSILYNVFSDQQHYQVDSKGKANPDFLCPNRPEIVESLRDILADMFEQPWFEAAELATKAIILDGIRFLDVGYCCCDCCIERFVEESGVDEALFHRLIEEEEKFSQPHFLAKWAKFRSKSLTRLLREIVSFAGSRSSMTAVYSGFSDESALLAGPVKRGFFLEDIIEVDANRLFIEVAENWCYDSAARAEVLYMLPLWRDAISERGKQVALTVHGYHMQNVISSINKLAEKTGIDSIVFAPMSAVGVEEVIRYYLSR
jgi:hypothetical protein